MIQCENCPNPISVLTSTHSVVFCLQQVTLKDGYKYFQCKETIDGTDKFQHYYCSEKCLVDHLPNCLNNHYSQELVQPIPIGRGFTNIHQLVLSRGFHCKNCNSELLTEAYRFAITGATPITSPLANYFETDGWCCSYACALKEAHSIVQLIKTRGFEIAISVN